MASHTLLAAVRAGDPDRYLSVLYAPEGKRDALVALYAFDAEIASIRDRIREAMPGEIRLQWWRDALAAGQPTGHPGTDALIEAMRVHGLPPVTFESYLEARTFDLYDDPMPATADLEGYCGETGSALIQLAAMILDPLAAGAASEAAGHAGCAQAIANLLRQLPKHMARGQCYLPRDLLAAAGATPEAFVAGETKEAAARAVQAFAALGRHHLAAFEQHAPGLPDSLRPAFLPLAVTPAYLGKVEKSAGAALTRPVEIAALRRQWLVLRRAMRGWR